MLGELCQNILWGVEIVWGVEKCLGGMPTNFMCRFEKKIGGGGVVMPKYFIDLKKCWGVCGHMPKHFRDLKKCWWGGGVLCPNILQLEKMMGGGVYANKFMDLKNVGGGDYAKIF